MTVIQAGGEGTTAGRIKSLKDGCGVVLASIFPLPLDHELGPRPQGRRQVRACFRDKRRKEVVNALASSLNWCSESGAPFAADSVPTQRDKICDSACQGVGRSVSPDVRDPTTASGFPEAAARPWRV